MTDMSRGVQRTGDMKEDRGRKKQARLVIFTDLDGTLLDSSTYSFARARPALDEIDVRRVPLVLCSSKTRAEVEVYRHRLRNGHPFIVENGGGIFIPAGYFRCAVNGDLRHNYMVISLGASYQHIREVFVRLREKMHAPVQGFGDMTADEIAALTGLPRDEALLAKNREFDEPFIFQGKPDGKFLTAVENEGLRWTRGKFYHVLGNANKGTAVRVLKKYYEDTYGKIITIGLGDSFNDLPLLREVDYPVLIRTKDGSRDEHITLPRLMKTNGAGPSGWNEAILRIFHDEPAAAH